MKNLFFALIVLTIILLLIYLVENFIIKKSIPDTSISVDKGKYQLILGKDAKQIFLHYRVLSMHGLSLSDAEKRIAEGGTYIDGLTNYHPRDKKLEKNPLPFLFLNISSLQNNYSNHQVHTCIMHECMHMAGILFNGCWDSHEEQMITWAELEANKIIKLLKTKKYI